MFSLKQKIQMVSWVIILFGAIAAYAVYQISEQVLHPPEYRPAERGGSLPRIERDSTVWVHYQGLAGDPKGDLGLRYENVEFPTVEGGVLRGWFVPVVGETKKAIVTVHGAYFDRRDFLRRLPMLHKAGYPVLMFDCREHGMSSGSGLGPGLAQREHFDVSAAVDYLRQIRGFESIALFGQSQGAVSSIIAAFRDPKIVAVIAENPFATLRSKDFPPPGMGDLPWWIARRVGAFIQWRADATNPVEAIDLIHELSPMPIMLMHGEKDQVVPPSHSQLLFAQAGEPKRLWIAPGADHDALINTHPEEYESRVLGFLSEVFEDVQ